MSASLSTPSNSGSMIGARASRLTTRPCARIRRKTTSTARASLTPPISAWLLTIPEVHRLHVCPKWLSLLRLRPRGGRYVATTVKECAGILANYSVEDLKTCYGGFEGFNHVHQSEQASADWGAATPQWMYVNGVYVNSTAHGDVTAWAEAVEAKICEDIDGIKPASCLTT